MKGESKKVTGEQQESNTWGDSPEAWTLVARLSLINKIIDFQKSFLNNGIYIWNIKKSLIAK